MKNESRPGTKRVQALTHAQSSFQTSSKTEEMKIPTKVLKKTIVAESKNHRATSERPSNPAVALKLHAPDAHRVCVVGSFNNWQVAATPLTPASGGVWSGELKLAPGRYEYLFVIDGSWLPDPTAREAVQNPFGGFNSVMRVN